ncbi:hypothetical protein [Pseudoxanthomonas mexicana]
MLIPADDPYFLGRPRFFFPDFRVFPPSTTFWMVGQQGIHRHSALPVTPQEYVNLLLRCFIGFLVITVAGFGNNAINLLSPMVGRKYPWDIGYQQTNQLPCTAPNALPGLT